jgi:hypothetical protein
LNVICVKGWEQYQHYKDRSPPWVKLYREMLTAESWVLGTDLSRLVQVASMLLAARYGNRIPYRFDLIKKVASLDCSEKQFTEAIRHLTATDFLEIQQVTDASVSVAQAASTPLASCTSEESQRQRRDRGETEESQSAHARARLVAGLDLEAWDEWVGYRAQRKPAIKRESLVAAAEELAAFATEQGSVVKHSIANGYQGLFAPKPKLNGAGKPKWVAPITAEEAEARERASEAR